MGYIVNINFQKTELSMLFQEKYVMDGQTVKMERTRGIVRRQKPHRPIACTYQRKSWCRFITSRGVQQWTKLTKIDSLMTDCTVDLLTW